MRLIACNDKSSPRKSNDVKFHRQWMQLPCILTSFRRIRKRFSTASITWSKINNDEITYPSILVHRMLRHALHIIWQERYAAWVRNKNREFEIIEDHCLLYPYVHSCIDYFQWKCFLTSSFICRLINSQSYLFNSCRPTLYT